MRCAMHKTLLSMHKVVQNGYGVPVQCAVAIVLSAALVAGGALAPAAAFADTESDLAAARAQLESIGQRVTELDAQLESATEALTQTDYQISELETQVSDPQPGDVCTSSTHCGIYIGNGQMIHASRPGVGVVIGSVQSNMIFVRMP